MEESSEQKVPEAEIKKTKNPRSHTLLWVTFALLLTGLIWLFYWLLYLQYHEFDR